MWLLDRAKLHKGSVGRSRLLITGLEFILQAGLDNENPMAKGKCGRPSKSSRSRAENGQKSRSATSTVLKSNSTSWVDYLRTEADEADEADETDAARHPVALWPSSSPGLARARQSQPAPAT
eukprot:CAMPEP_0170628386 /NCGR_PEP_ID=MMETSP0224-20130122/32644_1 /TAXON_ID=285029 /ORGANISM="Togula jolla, Strain CCCM 725" /LENGTH=121 /DNA_ID=CAMNT_0010955783 /DNA_START=409 /DNA_END=774 /DNA_ORIENTATION=-